MGNQFTIPSSTSSVIRIPARDTGCGVMQFDSAYPFQVQRMPHDEWLKHIHDYNRELRRFNQQLYVFLILFLFIVFMVMIPVSAVLINTTVLFVIFGIVFVGIFFSSIYMQRIRQHVLSSLRTLTDQKHAAFAAYGCHIRFCCEYHNSGSGRNRHKRPFIWLEVELRETTTTTVTVVQTAYPPTAYNMPPQQFPPQQFPPQQFPPNYPPQQQQYPPQQYGPNTGYPPQQYAPPQQQQYPPNYPPQQQYPPQYNQVVATPYYAPGPEYNQNAPPPQNPETGPQ